MKSRMGQTRKQKVSEASVKSELDPATLAADEEKAAAAAAALIAEEDDRKTAAKKFGKKRTGK